MAYNLKSGTLFLTYSLTKLKAELSFEGSAFFAGWAKQAPKTLTSSSCAHRQWAS
jgi:hypothetical protein